MRKKLLKNLFMKKTSDPYTVKRITVKDAILKALQPKSDSALVEEINQKISLFTKRKYLDDFERGYEVGAKDALDELLQFQEGVK